MEAAMRIAAVGDIHFTEGLAGSMRAQFERVADDAHVLLLAGDLTNNGQPDEMRALLDELAGVRVPIAAVLGNHDHESEAATEIVALMRERDVHVLDGGPVEVQIDDTTLGIAGVKGFCGGFRAHQVRPFGERSLKDFIADTVHEAKKLETAIASMRSDLRVALLHYAPIKETMGDESPEIYAFLGSSLLIEAIERGGGVHAIFHAHAHRGAAEARTSLGVPVYNVAMPILRRPYCVVTLAPAPAASPPVAPSAPPQHPGPEDARSARTATPAAGHPEAARRRPTETR
jgi:Icc-related predicted phosphoesterase